MTRLCSRQLECLLVYISHKIRCVVIAKLVSSDATARMSLGCPLACDVPLVASDPVSVSIYRRKYQRRVVDTRDIYDCSVEPSAGLQRARPCRAAAERAVMSGTGDALASQCDVVSRTLRLIPNNDQMGSIFAAGL